MAVVHTSKIIEVFVNSIRELAINELPDINGAPLDEFLEGAKNLPKGDLVEIIRAFIKSMTAAGKYGIVAQIICGGTIKLLEADNIEDHLVRPEDFQ